MNAPRASVILPVFNRAAWVARAIDSVLAQTYLDFELIVVDDGSTDGTAAILAGFGDRIRVLRQENLGTYAARNLGLRCARGELIAFADSDDSWHPDRLARQLPLLAARDVGLVFGDMALVAGEPGAGRRTGRTAFAVSPPARGSVGQALAQGNFVPTPTVLVRRACLEEIGGFEPSSRLAADYLAWVRIARRWRFDYVDAVLAEYSVHAGSISFDLGRSLAARIGLFEAELARTGGAEARLVRRLLFNLGVHLALAAVRGRAASVERPWAVAWRAASQARPAEAPRALAAFVLRQVGLRARRLLPGAVGSAA